MAKEATGKENKQTKEGKREREKKRQGKRKKLNICKTEFTK